MNYGKRLFTGIAVILVLIAGWFVYAKFLTSDNPTVDVTVPTVTNDIVEVTTTTSETTTVDLKSGIDTEKIKPNELGEIMVLMYHRIGDTDLEYDRSVASFKKDLELLYEKGFRSVSMTDYMNSHFDIPAGTTPVVFTFDDGDISHFKVARNEKGELIPDPNCAVGILDEFYRKHPDFGRNAIFYLNAYAFGESEHLEWKLNYLLENGYEIGNHTFGHESLDSLNAAGVQESIGKNVKYYKAINGKIDMNSIALPYGIAPVKELEDYAVSGEYKDQKYENKVLLLVGWRPTWPLYIKGINPRGINRVQCGEMEFQMHWWMDIYEQNPENRFISDGVPEIISVPKSWEEDINKDMIDSERLNIY
ncbi:MAG: polysaccharide deacetylase family protein [Bacillota bacterium]|nr:polysaccharide deacetylase family protein [Bacillota bacterium]